MSERSLVCLVALTAIVAAFGVFGCSKDDAGIGPASFPTDPEVFVDQFGSNVTFEAFAGSKLDAVQIDPTESYQGSQSLVATVPNVGDPNGTYAGGAFTTGVARDLSEFNALTFWARASMEATLDVVGIGNDNTGTSRYTAEVRNLPIGTNWQQYTIPIPLATKLTSERGLFFFSEGPEDGNGYTIWFDEIVFEDLGTIINPRPVLGSQVIEAEVGQTINFDGLSVTFDVNGSDIVVGAMPGYFSFVSSNEDAVSIASDGSVIATGPGTAIVTASLGGVTASGAATINVSAAQAVPTNPAAAPTVAEADVVSLYSDAYTNVTVDTWSADWDRADLEDLLIGTDNAKKYYNLEYAGIEFATEPVDASEMTRFHMDIWTPNATDAPAQFKVKLVDFGANGSFGGGDDSEHELAFGENVLSTGTWVSIDVPMLAFSGLTAQGSLAQMIISGDLSTVYVDNIYFYDAGPITAPSVSAPTSGYDAESVISLWSGAYSDVTVDTWSAVWDAADVEDYSIGSDLIKKYTNLSFAGIEFRTSPIDATAMTHFHMDLWTPQAGAAQDLFKVKLVDFGADGVSGGGDDIEHEIVLDDNIIQTGLWSGIDLALSDFTGLITRGHLAQLIISGDIETLYLDNIYFYDSGIPTVPLEPAPTPTLNADDVISLFSDAYTNHPVDYWSAPWDSAHIESYVIDGDSTKKYSSLLFAGVEFATSTIDATSMTHFHMDLWTPDPTASPAELKIKLVDFGANGVWDGGGDDVEHEITLDENSLATGSWVALDIPLTDFVNMTTKGHVAQLIISGSPNTIWIDNVYFHK